MPASRRAVALTRVSNVRRFMALLLLDRPVDGVAVTISPSLRCARFDSGEGPELCGTRPRPFGARCPARPTECLVRRGRWTLPAGLAAEGGSGLRQKG